MNNLSKALYGALLAFAILATANPAAASRYESLDDLFYKVASKAEGFAGAWYTEDGALNIAVKPRGKSLTSAEQKRALGALVDVFGKSVLEPTPDMKRPQPGIGTVAFRQVDYSWRELYDWYRNVHAVLKFRGVASTGIDERKNRIVIGFPGGKPTAEVINYLMTIDAPFSAILFGTSDKLYYYYSGSIVGSEQTPYLGGIELGLQQGGRCTLGLNAWIPVGWWQDAGFITAGHCGTFGNWWLPDGFTQPEGDNEDIIAAQYNNPDFFGGEDCPSDGCRYSDSALVRYNAGESVSSPAQVIRTRDYFGNPNIDDDNPVIFVTGESPWNLSGDHVYKVGVGRGWTKGAIGQTCEHRTAPHNEDFTFLCQYEVKSLDGAAIACEGDSGAPVFYWHETIMPNAAMSGILFAGTQAGCAPTYWFSPMEGVREDIGPFQIQY